MSEQITCGRCGIPHCVPPCKDCGKPAEGHLCEKDVANLKLQIGEVERLTNLCNRREISPDEFFGKVYVLFNSEKRV